MTLPNVVSSMKVVWWKRFFSALFLIAAAGLFGLLMRPWVPPATLWLTEVAITDEMNTEERVPVRVYKTVSAEQLRQGIYAYTAIHAPRGLNETIYHVWTHNGKVIDKVALHISGAREEGYRSWSRKENFPENSVGRWNIRVVTEANQLIGILRFRVVTAPGVEQPSKEPTTDPIEAPEVEAKTEAGTEVGTESGTELSAETSVDTITETSTETSKETDTETTSEEPVIPPVSIPSE